MRDKACREGKWNMAAGGDTRSRKIINSSKLMKDRVDIRNYLSVKSHFPQGQTMPG